MQRTEPSAPRAAAARGPAGVFRQRGLSMIELLISITIGLMIISAVGFLYVNSRGAYRTNTALARVQEDGRFGLDAILRDARSVGALGCNKDAVLRNIAATALALPGASGTSIPYAGSATALYGIAPSGYQFPGVTPLPSSTFQPPGPTPPTWIAGDVLQMVVPTSEPAPLTADPDNTSFTVTIANNSNIGLRAGDYVLVSDCDNATIANVTATPGSGSPAVVSLTASPLLPVNMPTQITLATHPSVQRLDAVTYYVGQYAGRPPALYRYSATYNVTEEIIDHVEDMSVYYGTPGVAPGPASGITAWDTVNSIRVSLQVVGDEQGAVNFVRDTTNAVVGPTVSLVPAVSFVVPDTRLRQIFTGTAAIRNRNS